SMDRALRALNRYRLLLKHVKVRQTQVVATAAVRDAANGPDFVREVQEMGLPSEVISADEEAHYSGLGVVSAFPGASGIVGDLGGGSLELVDIGGGKALGGISLPLGVLRVDKGKPGSKKALEILRSGLRRSGLAKA